MKLASGRFHEPAFVGCRSDWNAANQLTLHLPLGVVDRRIGIDQVIYMKSAPIRHHCLRIELKKDATIARIRKFKNPSQ